MKIYFDTTLLLKSYVPEIGSVEALALLEKHQHPVPFSHLLELELRTAIRVKHGRGEITAAEMLGTLQAVESDLAKGVLARPHYDLATVYHNAEAISAKHAASTLARSADIWHVAAALQSGCTTFASFDERQREVAERCRLQVIPAEINP